MNNMQIICGETMEKIFQECNPFRLETIDEGLGFSSEDVSRRDLVSDTCWGLCYLPKIDKLIINQNNLSDSSYRKVIRMYMGLNDLHRHEIMEALGEKECMKELLTFLNGIIRVRRRMRESRHNTCFQV